MTFDARHNLSSQAYFDEQGRPLPTYGFIALEALYRRPGTDEPSDGRLWAVVGVRADGTRDVTSLPVPVSPRECRLHRAGISGAAEWDLLFNCRDVVQNPLGRLFR